jgi:hypothetical protein
MERIRMCITCAKKYLNNIAKPKKYKVVGGYLKKPVSNP